MGRQEWFPDGLIGMCGRTAAASNASIFIGTAGWAIPSAYAAEFPVEGSALKRYAARFNAVEINSSFHRRHRAATWERWSQSVPDHFRFSVKMPKTITHQQKLADCRVAIEEFFSDISALGGKLAIVLVQLPPSLSFEKNTVDAFLKDVRARSDVCLVFEPRHLSWFTTDVSGFLSDQGIARVAADPVKASGADEPGGATDVAYWRWHGSPHVYHSSYHERQLAALAGLIKCRSDLASRWVIFDNTASGAATTNGLTLQRMCS